MEHRVQGLVIIAFSRLIIDRNMRKHQQYNNMKTTYKGIRLFFQKCRLESYTDVTIVTSKKASSGTG